LTCIDAQVLVGSEDVVISVDKTPNEMTKSDCSKLHEWY